MRALPLLLAVLAQVLPTPVFAAAATCDGKPATIVGAPGTVVWGTALDDVIVSNGARYVEGRDGDDRICMTGTPTSDSVRVLAGYGHDRVFGQTDDDVSAELGPGNDLYIGGPGRDSVYGADNGYDPDVGPRDAGLDRIATGPGADHVTIGQANLPTSDVVRLGRHSDTLTVIGLGGRGHIFDGNDGRDRFKQTWSEGSNAIIPQKRLDFDNTAEEARMGTKVVLRWDSFQDFFVESHPPGVRFSGSYRPESIMTPSLVGASMGGADDRIGPLYALTPSVLHGGAGRDQIFAYASSRDMITGDVAHGRIDVGEAPDGPEVSFTGMEDLRLLGGTVEVVGHDGPNRLDGYGCNVTIVGRGGNDALTSTPDQDYGRGCEPVTRMYGGDGDDRMVGHEWNDELYGGTGSDAADGSAGSDLCRAETRLRCERN